MRIRQSLRFPICTLICIVFLLTCFAAPQDPDEKLGRKDDPAGRDAWFRRGRQTRNGEPAAKALHRAYIAKMKMRAARESKFRSLAAARQQPSSALAASVGTWTNLGPRPIVDSPGAPNGYGPLAGRVTAIAVDQTDATGNTVLAAGAYGGVWRSSNAAASDPTQVQWTPLIDDQATLSVGAIALQPGNSNVILVGTGEPDYAIDSYYGVGILRSTDGGATWDTISNTNDGFSLYGTGTAQFAFSTKNPNIVMAAMSSFAVYPSTSIVYGAPLLSADAGASWVTIPFTNDNSNYYITSVSAIVYNPKEDKYYAVLPFTGVYVSNTTASAGITSFVRLKNQPGASGTLSLANCPLNGNGNCPLLRGAMTVRPVASSSDLDQMYIWFVANGGGGSGDDQGIWRSSTDSGGTVTWTQVSDSGISSCGDSYGCGTTQTFYNLYVNAVPNGTSTDLYAGTINIFKTNITCSGSTCTSSGFKNLTHVYGCNTISAVHPDQHALDFLVSNPNIIYFGDDGGVNRTLSSYTNLNTGSCPSGSTKANAFDNLNSHIGPLTQFQWGTNHPTDPSTLMGGSQDNGTMAVSGSSPAGGDAGWWEVNGGDGGYDWIDPVTPTNWYSAYTGVTIQKCTDTISCNTNTFLPIVEEDLDQGTSHQVDGDNSNFYTPYILDPAKTTQIIVGTCRVWRGGNTAGAWANNSTANVLSHHLGNTSDAACGSNTDPVQALAAGGPSTSSGSKVIYAGTSGGHLYMTSNATTGVATWTDVTSNISPEGFPVSAIVIDPSDATGMTAYAGIQGFTSSGSGHIWKTTNGGSSWTDESAALPPAPVNDLAIDADTDYVYAATDVGVFTNSASVTWTEVGPTPLMVSSGYLPNVAVLHIALYKNGSDKRLRAFTHGRGVWETALMLSDLTIAPNTLQVTANAGSSSTASSTITNNTSGAITLGAPALNNPSSSYFSLVSAGTSCGTTVTSLASGANCTIKVAFAPPAGTEGGTGDSVVLSTNDTNIPTITVGLMGTITDHASDFSFDFGSNNTSQTVNAGQTATYNFNLDGSPSGSAFNPSLSLTCSVPSAATKTTCTFSSSSVSTPGAVTMSIKTTAATTTSTQRAAATPKRGPGFLAALTFPALGLLILPMVSTKSRRKRMLMYSAMLLIALALLGMAACGGGGSGGGSGTTPT
ncbi:MAG TPA: hypothetical protein VGL89_16685, partial [Candidatus Koribacter sp.]